ncbi:MAG: hypothetical protein QXN26_04830 [Thermoplasmataceae archaeon]
MKHATPAELKCVDQLLEEVRRINGIREKQPGHFYYMGKNILHFHEDHGTLFADIAEDRVKVSASSYGEILEKAVTYISEIQLSRHSEKNEEDKPDASVKS